MQRAKLASAHVWAVEYIDYTLTMPVSPTSPLNYFTVTSGRSGFEWTWEVIHVFRDMGSIKIALINRICSYVY